MISISCELPDAPYDLKDILTAALQCALEHMGRRGDVDISIVDDAEIWRMNREYRNVDRPTDVLSFPSNEGYELTVPPDGFLGDIAISLPRAQAQAEEYGHSLERELCFLAIHGALHLMGYDHMQDEDRHVMEQLQKDILFEMGVNRDA